MTQNDFAQNISGRTSRRLLALAWPLGLAGLAESSMLIVDTWLLGGLGAAPLGAVAYGGVICFLLYTTCLNMMRGVKIAAAHQVGKKALDKAQSAFHAGLILAIGLSAVFLVVLHLATDISRAFGVAPNLLPDLHRFLGARAAGVPAACVMMAILEYRQAHGDTRPAPIVVASGALVHAGLALVFIGGHAGRSFSGVIGAGIATALTEWAQCIGLVFYAARRPQARGRAGHFGAAAKRAFVWVPKVLRLGAPSALQAFGEGSAYLLLTSLIAHMGDVSMAAHQLALSVLRVALLPAVALSEAVSVLVAQTHGAKTSGGIARVMRAGRTITLLWIVFSASVLALFGRELLALMGPPQAVYQAATQLVWLAIPLALAESQNLLFRAALRGLGDVRWQAALGIGVALACYATGGVVLGTWYHLGVLGAWLGLFFEKTIDALLFARRFWRRRKALSY